MTEKSRRCPKCGFHIRGKNHKEGSHHKYGKKGKLSVKKN